MHSFQVFKVTCPPNLLKPKMSFSNSVMFKRNLSRSRLLNFKGIASSAIEQEMLFYSLKSTSPVTLREMIEFGSDINVKNLIRIAEFLHNELPIRLAHLNRDLRRLPFGLENIEPITGVVQLYKNSFMRLREFPLPKDEKSELEFTELLKDIYARHGTVQQSISEGIQEYLLNNPTGRQEIFDLSSFLDKFYMKKISIRMLIAQHIELHKPQREGWVGVIQAECKPYEVAQDAIADAQVICKNTYGDAPDVKILGVGASSLQISYVPSHLHYIFFELLKNSMRAVVEYHKDSSSLPPVDLILADGEEDISIKISDRGGGIPRSGIDKIWSYAYTTAIRSVNQTPMAGYGHGLPLSRLYARYFGGDLQVISMEGFGTDAIIHISKANIDEQLPG